MSASVRQEGKLALEKTVEEFRQKHSCQIVTLAVIAHADIGFMLIGPDLQQLNLLEKRIALALGADVLKPVYSYFSITEKSEYTQTEEEFITETQQKENVQPGSPEMEEKLKGFRERIKRYTEDRLYPKLPDWEFVCFYPMSKRRDPQQNWYALDFAKRRELMGGHARVGRQFAGRVSQLVTGSAGMDAWEWGVTLFARNPSDIKDIVYQMRFDEVSHTYAEFGPFYNGLALKLPQIYERLQL